MREWMREIVSFDFNHFSHSHLSVYLRARILACTLASVLPHICPFRSYLFGRKLGKRLIRYTHIHTFIHMVFFSISYCDGSFSCGWILQSDIHTTRRQCYFAVLKRHFNGKTQLHWWYRHTAYSMEEMTVQCSPEATQKKLCPIQSNERSKAPHNSFIRWEMKLVKKKLCSKQRFSNILFSLPS